MESLRFNRESKKLKINKKLNKIHSSCEKESVAGNKVWEISFSAIYFE